MEQQKTSVFSNGRIWNGAAISIAEILTGTLFAGMGFGKGLLAIVLGHVLGCMLLYFAGLIGAKTGKSAMETVKISFGQKGALVFALLNVLQLVGWTSVMVNQGANAAHSALNLGGFWVWCLIIGAFIILWVMIGVKNLGKLNVVAMGALFVLTMVLSIVVFRGSISPTAGESMSFGAAVELSVAMPLSWLPLISDYTRTAKRKKAATFVSAATYFAVSCWMYVIGMAAAMFTGESDIAGIMLTAGLGVVGLLIIVLSTVTTTFLDVYSAGVSSVSLWGKIKEKWAATTVAVLGVVLAVFAPVGRFEEFLYLIGSVFAPMAAILIADYFITKSDSSKENFSLKNAVIWAVGFGLYRMFMGIDIPVGSTLPVMGIVMLICFATNKFFGGKKDAGKIS